MIQKFLNFNFIKFFIGQLAVNLADSFLQVAAIAILLTQSSTPGSAIALILFFYLLPSFLITPFIGNFIDTYSRKKIMLGSVTYRLILTIGFLYYIVNCVSDLSCRTELLYIYSFLTGIGKAFFYPTKMAVVPNLVSNSELKRANSLVSGSGGISTTSGSVFAGTFIAMFGILNCCYLGVVCYVLSALCLIFVRINKDDNTKPNTQKYDILHFFHSHRRILNMLLLMVVISLVSSTFYSAMNALATDTYNVTIAGLTKLKGMLGSGTMIGIAISFLFAKKLKFHKSIAFCFLALSVALLTSSFCTNYTRAIFWLGAIGIFATMLQITVDTVIQKATNNSIRGKVFAFKSMATTAFSLTGTLLASILVGVVSPLSVFKAIAVVCLLISALIIICDKDFRYFLLKSTIGALFLSLYNYKVEGINNLPKTGKCLLAGNHTGILDSLILQMATNRKLWFVTGERAFELPIIKHLLKYYNVIPIVKNKGKDALQVAVDKLKQGEAVVIFPEGKLSRDDSVLKFNRGVAIIAKESNTPITPFSISGGFESWRYNRRYPSLFKKITLVFCSPIKDVQEDEKATVKYLQDVVNFSKSIVDRRMQYKISKKLYDNFVDLIRERAYNFSDKTALTIKDKNGYSACTYLDLTKKAKNFANYMIANNMVDKGDRIALLSEARPEWAAALFATIQSGGILVPLDIKLTISELTSILSDCLPRILCVSSHYIDMAYQIKEAVPSIERIFVVDETENEYDGTENIHKVKGDLVSHLAKSRNLDETAYIVYTSGTTGSPKGVMVSFANIYSQLKDFEKILALSNDTSLVSILPLNHLLELNVGLMGMLYLCAKVTYVKSLYPKEIAAAMKDVQATHMLVVPLFAKMLKGSVEKEIRKNPKTAKVFDIMYSVAKFVPQSVRRIMFKQILDNFGGKLKFFISGGAPLDIETAEFFERIGIPAYQGYGLTETSPVISTNYPHNNRNGSVGRPLPWATVKIADNGEILVKGHGVMQGYYNQPEKTAEVIDEDGWFHTGDIGEIDKDGFLFITGRIKNMIVLGGGKKIFPEEVEAVLEKSELFKELCVLSLKIKSGNKAGTEEVGAILVPADNLQAKSDEELQKMFEDEVKRLGANLASYKVPTTIVIHRDELPKTPTKKVKRKVLLEWYDNLNVEVV